MSGRRRNLSGKSTSSLDEIPEAHVAKLKRQLQERERKKSEGEIPRHDIPREPPLSPSSKARAEEERINKLWPVLPGYLVEKYGRSSYVQRDAELSAASRSAVAPTPDAVRVSQALLVPPPETEATATSQVPCSLSISSVVTHSNQLSLQPPLKESSTATEFVERRRSAYQKLTDLQSEEKRGKDRIALIERTIEELNSERKALTDKVLSLKQEQYDLLLSTMPLHPFASNSPSRSSEPFSKTPVATEGAKTMEEASPLLPMPPAATTELLSRMHQLEENGVHGDTEVVPSDPVVNVSLGSKRKLMPSEESEQKKRKCSPTNSPSRNTVDIPPVEKPEQVPTNGAPIQPEGLATELNLRTLTLNLSQNL